MRRTSLLIFSLLVLALQIYGQNVSGQMSGRILDPQGAAVPNATVTATDASKQISVATKTNEQGDFVVAGLQPGTSALRVEAGGFKRLDKRGVPLDANDNPASLHAKGVV